MIEGVVTSDREPIVRLGVCDASGNAHEFEAVVDTGFTGWLTLPPDMIAKLGLTWREWGAAILADGSQIIFKVYDAVIMWDGQAIHCTVDEADAEPLNGMRLMQGYRILIEDIDGGIVRLERMQ
jgi:clan AA aspartic protease